MCAQRKPLDHARPPASIRFDGLTPWPHDAGMIECAGTALGLVDLHNECDVRDIRLAPAAATLSVGFRHIPTATPVRLLFTAVELVRVDVGEHGDPDTFHGVDHYLDPRTGRPIVELDLGRRTVVLHAGTVAFEVTS